MIGRFPQPDPALGATPDPSQMSEADYLRMLGLDQAPAALPTTVDPVSQTRLQQFLEGLGGLQNIGGGAPQTLGAGLIQGLAGGLGRAGNRVAAERQKYEATANARAAANDLLNRKATEDYRKERSGALKDLEKTKGDTATRAETRDFEYPPATQEQIDAAPKGSTLSRTKVGTRVSRKELDAAMFRESTPQVETIVGPGGKPVIVPRAEAIGKQPYYQPRSEGGLNALGAAGDEKAVAEMIHDGRLAPTYLSGRPTQYSNRIVGELKKIDPKFNLTLATLDYVGAKQYYSSLNQSGQLRFRQAATNAGHTIDAASELVDQLYAIVPSQQIKKLNEAQFNAVLNGGFGPQAAGIAQQLLTHAGALQSEMASVYAGGNAPTDDSRHIAGEGISGKFPLGLIRSGLTASRRAINIRLQSAAEQGPVGPSNPMPASLEQAEYRAGQPTNIGLGQVGGAQSRVPAGPKPGGFFDRLLKGAH